MSGAEATATVSIEEKGMGLDFWCQITNCDLDSYIKEEIKKGKQSPPGPSASFQPQPIHPKLAAELRPFNGFYTFILICGGPQFPISPNPGPIMPGPIFGRGFLMIDRSVEYSPNPKHKICITSKVNLLTFVEDITSQIISSGGFDPSTHTMSWFLESLLGERFYGSAMFTSLALTAHNSFTTSASGKFAEMPMIAVNQLAPAGLDIFVGNYQHVIGGTPPCTFSITKSQDGYQCTITQPPGNTNKISAKSVGYNSQMYLLKVPDDPQSGLQGFITMLGTFGPVGLVAYVMGKSGNGFIGINEKPESHHETDRLQNSALWSRMLMHNADPGKTKKAKKAEAAKKTQQSSNGVPVHPEVAHGMHPFNGFYSLKGDHLKDDTANWLLIDRQVTYYTLKSPEYKVQVTYQLNGSKVTDISEEATKNFDPKTNSIKFDETQLTFSTQPLSKDQPNASQLEGQIKTSEGKIVQVTGTNSLAAPEISMYAGNYWIVLKQPSKGPSYTLNLYYNNNNEAKQGTFEISITNLKTLKSTVVPYFSYDPAMFTVDIPAYPKGNIPKMLVMLGTVANLGCVAYIIIHGKKPSESQITFLSTNI